MAEQWANHLGRPGDEPPAKARAVANSKSDLERELLVLVARLSVKNAADLRLLCSMAYSTLKFEANHGAVKTCEQARALHAERTRGQSGHKEGQPDEYALVALLLALKPNADAQLQQLIDDFLTDHPPKDPKLAQAVKVCRVQNMHVSTHKKLFLRLADDQKPLEQALVAALVADGGEQLFGQAPRGSLERKAIDLMQKLGVKNNWETVIGSVCGVCLAPALSNARCVPFACPFVQLRCAHDRAWSAVMLVMQASCFSQQPPIHIRFLCCFSVFPRLYTKA